MAAATTVGTASAALLLRAGDAWSTWVLNASTGGQFTARLAQFLDLGGKATPFAVLVLGTIAMFFALAQAVLMLIRQAALVILAGVLPLAAAGSIAPLTRPWIRKITAWMLALICYKPAAAAVYAAAFTLIGTSRGPASTLTGLTMLILSVVTLPALMKLFTWTAGTVGGASGGGGQFLSTAAMGAVALGAMRSSPGGAGTAQDQAAFLSSRLGPGGTGTGAGAPGPGSAAASAASLARNGPSAAGAAGAGPAAGAAASGASAAASAADAAASAARRAGAAMDLRDQL
jgi:hypothetical protein